MNTHIDLSDIPVIDNHNHPFPIEREDRNFERYFCIGLYKVPNEDMRNTLYFHMMINELRRFFKMPISSTADEVITKRNSMAFNHRKDYVQSLFNEAKYIEFLTDFGFPISRKRNPDLIIKNYEIEEFKDHCEGIKIHAIDRIEWICNDLLEQHLSFDDFEKLLVRNTKKMIEEKNLVAIKSVIAYFTGLEVKILSQQGFRDGYYAYLSDKTNIAAEKIIRDFTFLKACEICSEMDIPLQVHTGLGDSPDCHIIRVNPALLTDAINDPRVYKTKLVLIHGGYPYVEQLGMIVNHYENVYADLSSFIPFASIAAEEKVRNILELAPFNKLFFGTDGGSIPENIWLGAMYFKRVFTKILNDLIDSGYISYEFALQSAENVLYKNVKRIYRI